jgi:serine/threonine-protein kinase
MDSSRWQKVQALFHEAAGVPPSERRAFVDSRSDGDAALAAEVLTLLEEDSRGDSLLDRDIGSVADQILNQPADNATSHRDFGPYRAIRPLGEGGMGVVFLAERDDLGSQVAIKVLRDAWLSPARRARFAAEQRTLAQLNHPAIARLYDADTLPDGTPFFVMEYVEGITLNEYCRRRNCSVAERLRLFREVCQAVLFAHQNAVIHRDLKPSNILVKDDGSVRLLDFGIAKQIETLGQSADQTITALRLMTPAYAAPEQFRGEQVGILADVYSLGVVLYELLAGRLPFDVTHRTPAQVEKIVTEDQPDKPSEAWTQNEAAHLESSDATSLGESEWADLDVLCLTAMHKDPSQRYQSVEALIRDVDHYLNGEPLEARPDSLRYVAGKFVRRHWQWISAAAAAFAILVALVVIYTVKLTRARNAAIAEAARTQRIQNFMLNLFQGGDASAGPAGDLRVVSLLDRGVLDARGLDAEPAAQADLYDTLGGIDQKLGRFDQAEKLLQSALIERRATFGPDSPETAQSLLSLGALRDAQAQYDEAEKLTREALDINKRKLKPNDPAIGKSILQLGGIFEDRGQYSQSIATLEKTVDFFSVPGSSQIDLADSLYELANANYYAGNHEVAEGINLRALVMYKRIYGDRHPRVADVLINLGAIKLDSGHYPEAEMYDRDALAIVQNWYGKDNVATATDLTLLARALVYEGRYDEASSLLQQSLAIKEAAYGKVHPSVASTLNELGSVELKQGKNYDAAIAYFTRMADICSVVYGEKHYWYATAIANTGSVYMAQKDWPRAEREYRIAIPIYTEAQSATSTNVGIARIKLGRVLLRQRRYAEAETESREGYDILVKQMDPKVSWLVNARNDLVEEYQAMKQPDEAAKFQALIAANTPETKPAAAH